MHNHTGYERITAALKATGSRRSGHDWQCPAHDDRTPSLTVKQDYAKAMVYCHAGCSLKEIMAALGLEARDVYDAPWGSSGVTETRLTVSRLRDGIPALEWPRTWRTDQLFYRAILDRAHAANTLDVNCSVIDLAQDAGPGVFGKGTASAALYRLGPGKAQRKTPNRKTGELMTRKAVKGMGLITLGPRPKGNNARLIHVNDRGHASGQVSSYGTRTTLNKYVLTEGTNPPSLLRPVCVQKMDSVSVIVPENLGDILRPNGVDLYRFVDPVVPRSQRELSRLAMISPETAGKKLKIMARLGMVVHLKGEGWVRGPFNPWDYDPDTMSLCGPTATRKRERYAEDRAQRRAEKVPVG